MAYWIIKTEPGSYSWQDLERDTKTSWDGVRNYQARNNLRSMKLGDLAMVYHSVGPKELVGIVKISREAFSDTDPWLAVEVELVQALGRTISLLQIKENHHLAGLSLVKQSRLSVCPVRAFEWKILMSMANWALIQSVLFFCS